MADRQSSEDQPSAGHAMVPSRSDEVDAHPLTGAIGFDSAQHGGDTAVLTDDFASAQANDNTAELTADFASAGQPDATTDLTDGSDAFASAQQDGATESAEPAFAAPPAGTVASGAGSDCGSVELAARDDAESADSASPDDTPIAEEPTNDSASTQQEQSLRSSAARAAEAAALAAADAAKAGKASKGKQWESSVTARRAANPLLGARPDFGNAGTAPEPEPRPQSDIATHKLDTPEQPLTNTSPPESPTAPPEDTASASEDAAPTPDAPLDGKADAVPPTPPQCKLRGTYIARSVHDKGERVLSAQAMQDSVQRLYLGPWGQAGEIDKEALAAMRARERAAQVGGDRVMTPDEVQAATDRLYTIKPARPQSAPMRAVKVRHVRDEAGRWVDKLLPAETRTQAQQQQLLSDMYQRDLENAEKREAALAEKYLKPLGAYGTVRFAITAAKTTTGTECGDGTAKRPYTSRDMDRITPPLAGTSVYPNGAWQLRK